jgi:hypothetical protein
MGGFFRLGWMLSKLVSSGRFFGHVDAFLQPPSPPNPVWAWDGVERICFVLQKLPTF